MKLVRWVWLTFVALLVMTVVVDAQGPKHKYKMVCYIGTWSNYRPGNGRFNFEHVDPFLCTHLVYSFAGLDNATNAIKGLDDNLDIAQGGFKKFVGLKDKNPNLKTLIAIGGWNEGAEKYSKMASNKTTRAAFITSVVDFLQKHKFDGLDLDWEYPASQDRGGKPEDKKNFVDLVKELYGEFKPRGWLLTAAIGAPERVIDTSYDIPSLARYLDFINVMCYDYNGKWNDFTGHNSPLYSRPDEKDDFKKLNINSSIHHLLSLGAPASSLVLGMPLYGRSFLLADADHAKPGSESVRNMGLSGRFSNEAGFMGYNEFCEDALQKPWIKARDEFQKVPYAHLDKNWFSYDDQESLKLKVEFAVRMRLGGAMVWSLETDDFTGACKTGKFPLMKSINDALVKTPPPQDENNETTSGSDVTKALEVCVLLALASTLMLIQRTS